jgi:hypothetical protein
MKKTTPTIKHHKKKTIIPYEKMDYSPIKTQSLSDVPQNNLNQIISPSYYPDMTLPMIGKRPIFLSRTMEHTIPRIMIRSNFNLMDSQFDCTQPFWNEKCK